MTPAHSRPPPPGWRTGRTAAALRWRGTQVSGPALRPRPRPCAPASAPRGSAPLAAASPRRQLWQGGGPAGSPCAGQARRRAGAIAPRGGGAGGEEMAWTNEVEYHRAKAARRAARGAGPPRQPASLSGHTSPLRFAVVAGWRPSLRAHLCVGKVAASEVPLAAARYPHEPNRLQAGGSVVMKKRARRLATRHNNGSVFLHCRDDRGSSELAK